MTDAVLDAGPLIHLAELDALDVLRDFTLYVPDAVWEEVDRHQPNLLSTAGFKITRVITPEPSAELQTIAQALALDRGELEALALLETMPHAMFLTDDAAARLAAEEHSYHVHGTLGLLIRRVRRRHRSPGEILKLL
jgi:predicted nucleic acid-binding protein